MELHEHRCIYCGHARRCAEPGCSQPQQHICAICEALDRMRRELPYIEEFSSRSIAPNYGTMGAGERR
jgi:hypothetical protein